VGWVGGEGGVWEGNGEMNRGGPGRAAAAAVGDDGVGWWWEGGVVAVIC